MAAAAIEPGAKQVAATLQPPFTSPGDQPNPPRPAPATCRARSRAAAAAVFPGRRCSSSSRIGPSSAQSADGSVWSMAGESAVRAGGDGWPLACTRGDVIGNVVEPGTDRLSPVNLPGLLRQHQEAGLESILGVGIVAEHAPAHAHHHRPMAADQRRECLLVTTVREAIQQLPITGIGTTGGAEQAADAPHRSG